MLHFWRVFGRDAVVCGLVGLGLTLSIAMAGAPADAPGDVEGPALVGPKLVRPESMIGNRYEPAEKPKEEPRTAQPPKAKSKPKAATMPEAEPASKAEPKPEPGTEAGLSPEMVALRDGLRRTVAKAQGQWFNTRDHSVTDILHVCLAYGCAGQVRQDGPSGEVINAVTCLCWDYPCRGEQPLVIAEGHITARIGYGLQTERSQFLAVLAQSRVPIDYPVRVGEEVRKVADVVEYEKLSCRNGVDASLKLIGLSFYLDNETTWKNSLGESWSLERLVEEELGRASRTDPEGGLPRLMGLSYAVRRQIARKLPLKGAYDRAGQYLRQYHDHALKCQNSDGSWHPTFFASVGSSRDTAGTLRSTGHILEWLAFSLPDDRLQEPGVVKAVAKVDSLLGQSRYLGSATSLRSEEVGSMMHAIHGLTIYDQRVFRPYDPKEPAEIEKKPAGASQASHTSTPE